MSTEHVEIELEDLFVDDIVIPLTLPKGPPDIEPPTVREPFPTKPASSWFREHRVVTGLMTGALAAAFLLVGTKLATRFV